MRSFDQGNHFPPTILPEVSNSFSTIASIVGDGEGYHLEAALDSDGIRLIGQAQ